MHSTRTNSQFVNKNIKTLWIGNLEPSMDEAYIRSKLSLIAPVMTAKTVINRMTGKPAGYGFVEFETHEIAAMVLEELNGQQIPGTDKYYKLNWAVNSGKTNKNPHSNNSSIEQSSDSAGGLFSVYCGNLDFSVTDSILQNAFKDYTTVINAHVNVNPVTNISKGFGFVKFSDFNESQKAIQEMNGKHLLNRPLRVSVGFKKIEPPKIEPPKIEPPVNKPTRNLVPSYQKQPETSQNYNYGYFHASNPQASYPQSSYPASSYPAPPYPQSINPAYPQLNELRSPALAHPASSYPTGPVLTYPNQHSTQASTYNYDHSNRQNDDFYVPKEQIATLGAINQSRSYLNQK